MPDGITFKKLDKAEEEALKRYYRKQNPLTLDKASDFLANPAIITGGLYAASLIVATSIAAVVYIFRDDIVEKAKAEGYDAAEWLGGGLYKYAWSSWMGAFTNATGPKWRGEDEISGPAAEDICTRWTLDAQDLVSDNTPFIAKWNLVTKLPLVLKEMHKNGCSKPPWITQQNWDKAGRL